LSNLRNLRILIIDDDGFMRRTIRAMLRAIDSFVVTEAEGGEVALALLGNDRPDVILCDIGMAPMDGLQFVKLLRAHPNPLVRETAVVVVTGHAEQTMVQTAAQLNIRGYLIKPISPKQLENRLNAIFRDRQPPGTEVAPR
jgi:two-component system, chemotaxis family, chemotaxis protein CheY